MKHCSHCKVDFSGNLDTCPLCQRPLTGTPSPAVFPHAAIVKPQKLMISFVFFGSGAAVFTMALLCGLGVIPPNIALLVSGVVVANGLFVRNLIVQNPGFVRGASRYLLLLIGLALLCYLLTQADFFTSLVIPIICLSALAFDVLLLLVRRQHFAAEFAKYLICDVICGFIPLVLVLLGFARWPPLAFICAFCSAILGLFVFVFLRQELFGGTSKLFNA